MKKAIVITAALLLAASTAAYAQMRHQGSQQNMPMQHGPGMMQGGGQHGGMHGGGAGNQPRGDNSPSSLAFRGINAKMHEAMDITFTGNTDVDFVKGMIPHHQGAIDMAKTVLAFGKDPEIRKLAEGVIKAQEGEIAFMREWLKKNSQ